MVLRDLLGHSSALTTEAYLRRLDMTRIYADAYEQAANGAPAGARAAAGREAAAEFDAPTPGRRLDTGGAWCVMPAELLTDPLGIACEFSDGRRKRWLSGGAGDPALVADLLTGLAQKVHPHGTVNAPGTVDAYLIGLRDIAAFMAARGVRGGATVLTRAVLAEYWMQAGGNAGVDHPDDAGRLTTTPPARLDAGVRALVDGRRYSPWPSGNPLEPYDQRQWEQLQGTCRRIVDDAFAAHRRALAAAAAGRDPAQAGWSGGNLRWLLVQHGPLSTAQVAAHLGVSDLVGPAARRYPHRLRRAVPRRRRRERLPGAVRVLLRCRPGRDRGPGHRRHRLGR